MFIQYHTQFYKYISFGAGSTNNFAIPSLPVCKKTRICKINTQLSPRSQVKVWIIFCNVWRNLHVYLKMLFVPSLLDGILLWGHMETVRAGTRQWTGHCCVAHNCLQSSRRPQHGTAITDRVRMRLKEKLAFRYLSNEFIPKILLLFMERVKKNKKSILIIVFYT